ncbi:MAG: hypothetical protein QXE31_02840 [Candidatus Woesearchaeota archaeon]
MIIVMKILLIIFLFLLSSLPLYYSVKLMKGKITFLKAMFVSFMIGIIVSAINLKFKLFGSFLSFLITIWLYHEIFRLKWYKAFLVWLLQLLFLAIFYLFVFLFGLSLIGINLILF